ncbi:hypothetical protein LZ31DRAFT_288006 [Colletotrichum somersetense]|nr:hypothetical protein LZ31DRAFT_288006 [Colletotrichum somersetense]
MMMLQTLRLLLRFTILRAPPARASYYLCSRRSWCHPRTDRFTLRPASRPACGLLTTPSSQAKARASFCNQASSECTCLHDQNFASSLSDLTVCGPPGRIAGCFSCSRATYSGQRASPGRRPRKTERRREEEKGREKKKKRQTPTRAANAKPVAKCNHSERHNIV